MRRASERFLGRISRTIEFLVGLWLVPTRPRSSRHKRRPQRLPTQPPRLVLAAVLEPAGVEYSRLPRLHLPGLLSGIPRGLGGARPRRARSCLQGAPGREWTAWLARRLRR